MRRTASNSGEAKHGEEMSEEEIRKLKARLLARDTAMLDMKTWLIEQIAETEGRKSMIWARVAFKQTLHRLDGWMRRMG